MSDRSGEWMLRTQDMEEFGRLMGQSNAALVSDEAVLVHHFVEQARAMGLVFFGIRLDETALEAFKAGLVRGWQQARKSST